MKPRLLASLLCLYACVSAAQTTPLAQTLAPLMAQYLAGSSVGIIIQDASSKEILYSHNKAQGFTPASITKSFSAAASLISLGENFRYHTTLQYDATQLQDGVLNDHLYLVFKGDPSLSSAELIKLLDHVKQQGIHTINGDIVIDNTYFTKPYPARGIGASDLNWYYGTPAKTVIIDENQIPIILKPGASIGQAVSVRHARADLTMPIINELITASPQEAKTLCQINVELNDNNAIHLYGCWPQDAAETTLKVALNNPELRVTEIIQQTLKPSGQIRVGKMPKEASAVLATYQSPPLNHLNRFVLQKSNNLYADSLTKVLGQQIYQRGTAQAGSYALLQILKTHLGLDISRIRLYDGAGASNYNEVTPESVAALLQAMYDQTHYRQPYLEAMRVNADHPFDKRKPADFTAPLYIKTGSMTGVSNVVGYVKTPAGNTLIVVLLINQLPLDRSQAQRFEQLLLEAVVKI